MMCGQREDAEEVAQETLLKVFENFEHLREPEHVKSWVFQIARNNCLMKRRKSVFAPTEEVSVSEVIGEESGEGVRRRIEVPDEREAPDEHAQRGEVRGAL